MQKLFAITIIVTSMLTTRTDQKRVIRTQDESRKKVLGKHRIHVFLVITHPHLDVSKDRINNVVINKTGSENSTRK